MSIPPLVCSTPPPPDQCEDDKDPEDFDLHYNLSQDDDYDYGSFSTYSHFQSAISESKPLGSPIINNTNNNVNNSDNTGKHNDKNDGAILQRTTASTEINLGHNDEVPVVEIKWNTHEDHDFENTMITDGELPTQDKLDIKEKLQVTEKIYEEEPNVEDLNLTIEEEELSSSTSSNVKNQLYEDTHSDKFDSSDKDKELHIPDMTNSIKELRFNETISPLDNMTLASTSKDNIEESPKCKEDGQLKHEEEFYCSETKMEYEPTICTSDFVAIDVPNTSDPTAIINNVNIETDDEFEDINAFHVASANKESSIDVCVNPWENNQPDSDFEAFEAHFDESERIEPSPVQAYEEKSIHVNQNEGNNIEDDDDDDFGDFDEFKSSMQQNTNKEEMLDPLSQVPVLNFQTSDTESQVLENINKILNAIFTENIPVPESVFDGKLESLLCETWGHLLETDVRQPYIVNWNNSIGQKTLLKALCIDSRNILFGPKWNYNMPKYAVNLSAAPLQPQKQSTGPPAEPDKSSARPPTVWADPFTADGQEFTYAEALLLDLEHLMATLDQMAHNHSNLKISELLSHACTKENNDVTQKRPTDLNILDFDSTLSSKSNKIYSSTLGIQPLRQISLPDTHIFTPTDSETPRSKTIHYDEPSVFLPPSSIENDAKSIESVPSSTELKNEDDGDYSDFQDFKGSFDVNGTQSTPASELAKDSTKVPGPMKQPPASNPTYPIGILQPIKLEPTIPTLNWPSPGEVKETFDDFSEFASNTTWNNETETPNIEVEKIHSMQMDSSNTVKNEEVTSSKNNDSFDDDFDTFQSALPATKPAPVIPTLTNLSNVQDSLFSQNISAHSTSNIEKNLDFSFSDIHTVKSDAISLTRPIDILKSSEPSMHQISVENTSKAKEPIVTVAAPQLSIGQTVPVNLLQPIVSAPQVQQNTTQILQPLSLESFSQINWPNPGINLQDLSRFNPVETLNSLKNDQSVSGNSKGPSPVHNQKSSTHNQEDDIWGDFVSSKPKSQQTLPTNASSFVDDDEWTDFVSSPTVKPQNGLNTISLNVHTNLNMQKSTKPSKLTVQSNQALEIPTLNYITPKSSNHSSYNDRHFQNL